MSKQSKIQGTTATSIIVDEAANIDVYASKVVNGIRACRLCHKRKKDILRPLCEKCEEVMHTEMGQILYGKAT